MFKLNTAPSGAAIAAAIASAFACHGVAQAADPACPPRAIRWQEDCSGLATKPLTGIDWLRYKPITANGDVWLSVGGEARVRMDALYDGDFGLNGAEGYTQTAGRLLLHGDLRSRSGVRAFAQLGIVEANNRKPALRAQDKSEIDITQAFVDLPLSQGPVHATLRFGRQEIDLSVNRLVTTRDGATLRRAFEGTKLDLAAGDWKVAVVSVRPMSLADDAFADRSDRTERFTAVSVDAPRGMFPNGSLNLFTFDRQREDARWLRGQGKERRQTLGAHYAGRVGPWSVDIQGAGQTGRVEGKPVRAYGAGISLDRDLPYPGRWAVGLDAVIASGDKAGTRAVETFDPTYPNNGGLSDATVFFQTNYMFAGGGVTKVWKGATFGANANLLARQSTEDGVYTSYFGGRAINAGLNDKRLTSLLMQLNLRKAMTPRTEIYASVVKGHALGSISDAGGKDIFYSRVQLTARF